MTNSARDAAIAVVVGLVFASIGGYLLYGNLQAEQNTEAVDATVVESSLNELPDDKFRPEVTYRYTYDGQTYMNDNVWVGSTLHRLNSDEAQSILDEYPEGETVTAHVYPDDPSRSYLRADSNSYLFPAGFIAMGLLCAVVGVSLLRKHLTVLP